MLREFVNNQHTVFAKSFDSWESVITATCQPLINEGSIDERYIESVIQCVKDYGPYHCPNGDDGTCFYRGCRGL